MKKKDITSFILETAKKLNDADGIPLDICDDFRKCIAMVQDINAIGFIKVSKELELPIDTGRAYRNLHIRPDAQEIKEQINHDN
tara:strand:+ start:212 stop:463 length:252 start_codon:yes stop_codon:yes gene_type:complete